MMAHILILCAYLCFSSHAVQAASQSNSASARPIAVLVPGFFNSLADGSPKGPYFSRDIVAAIEESGFEVRVVDNLLPIGRIETNARILVDYLRTLQSDSPGRFMVLIGHSAGGLYALRALTLAPDLNVSTVATVSTPFAGVNFITQLADSSVVRTLTEWFHLDSLKEFTREGMAEILKSIHVPRHVRLIVTGGSQEGCGITTCYRAERLSWLLTITDALNGEESDGIVPISSAYAVTALGAFNSADASSIAAAPQVDAIHLEHWEQVLDYRVFSLLGTTNRGYVRDEQRRFYSNLMKTIGRIN